MNLHELRVTRDALRKQLSLYEHIQPACNNCEKMSAHKKCSHFEAVPPAEWLVGPVECEHWRYDFIPF